MGFSKAILGSSGGIDSAVTQVLAVEALGKENVRALLMPSQYSSSHSVADAEALSKKLCNPYDIVAIKQIYETFLSELKPIFKELPFSIAEENIQSRTRGNLLMAVANKFGYILLNTSNSFWIPSAVDRDGGAVFDTINMRNQAQTQQLEIQGTNNVTFAIGFQTGATVSISTANGTSCSSKILWRKPRCQVAVGRFPA